MSKIDYDVIIIGAGIGGLSTAALLVKEGFKVIVVEQNEGPGGRCGGVSKNGYVFDIGASLFWGFEEKGAFNSLFHKLGLLNTLLKKEKIKKLDPGLQVVLPNHRINIYSKRNMFFEELKREFPKAFDDLKEFYTEIDEIDKKMHDNDKNTNYPYTFNLRKKHSSMRKNLHHGKILHTNASSKNLLNDLTQNLETEKFFDIQTMYFGQNTAANSSLLFSSIVLGIPRRGIYYVKGGSRTIVNILSDFIKRHGGDITYGSTVEEILIKKRSSSGVRVKYDAVTVDILSRCVVSALPVLALSPLIKTEKAKKIYNKFLKGMRQKYVPFTVLLGVDEKVIPEPMKEHVFMIRDYSLPAEDDNFIFITVNPEWDKTRAPAGKRAISASIFLSKENITGINMEEFTKKKTAAIISHLEQVMPFLSQHIDTTITIDPLTYQKLTKCKNGCIGMLEGADTGTYGFQGTSNIMPFNNLLLVGDSTFPGHGTVSAVKSGLEAVSLISG